MSDEIPHEYWIQTCMGGKVDYINPTIEMCDIRAIARGLSQESRFAGQGKFFYSVAQHSMLACMAAPEGLELECLLHDFPEGLGFKDIPGPLKRLLGCKFSHNIIPDAYNNYFNEYKNLSNRLLAVGIEAFRLSYLQSDWTKVKEVDLRLAVTEEKILMPNEWYHQTEGKIPEPYRHFYKEIKEYPMSMIEQAFLDLYEKYKRI